jgi:S-adenosylmethionine hydrolase
MKGVAVSVSADIALYDLTHEIPVFNIWEAALRLDQAASYWPPGTVFVSVVDPGVGTDRRSVVMLSASGHYFVTPDNGTLTFVAESLGVTQVREIDEAVNRLQNSAASYTFHGRDVYAYTGARLAAGIIEFSEVGRDLGKELTIIPYQKALIANGGIAGNIPVLDVQYGNVWTNVPRELMQELGIVPGTEVQLQILHADKVVVDMKLPFRRTFGEVGVNQALLYINSLGAAAVAINLGNFAEVHGIGSGSEWNVFLAPVKAEGN